MKKLLLIPVLSLMMASCSTDDQQTIATAADDTLATVEVFAEDVETAAPTEPFSFSAKVTVDIPQGLNRPIINFIATEIPADVPSTQGYYASVEIQALADAEDITTGTGDIHSFGENTPVYGIATATVKVSTTPGQLLPEYRWRFVLKSESGDFVGYTEWFQPPIT